MYHRNKVDELKTPPKSLAPAIAGYFSDEICSDYSRIHPSATGECKTNNQFLTSPSPKPKPKSPCQSDLEWKFLSDSKSFTPKCISKAYQLCS